MDGDPRCQRCGVALTGQAVGELCANCLLKLALDPPFLAANHKSGASTADSGHTAITAPLTEVPGTVIGPYKLREKLGEGGFGVVYVAEQDEPVRRRVALKVIKLGMDTRQVVARFEAERQALAMMDHPNIARVLDAGTTQTGRPYFVMELVRGIRITDYCDQNQLSTKERLELFIKICQAIQHAHQKGIIHRDIKPSNLLVTLHDGVPVPKVIDFGIAKATEGRLTNATVYTQLHQFIGTPAYMSPEQAEMSGLDIDTRSDIYALGVLLYELLTGKTPFDAQELMTSGLDAMRKTIREKEPLRPSTRLGTMLEGELTTTAKRRSSDAPKLIRLLEGDLDWIVMKCLEKDRARRYVTANGVAADLKRHLENEPVVARPPSAAYRVQKAWRRNRLAFAAGIAVVAALTAGFGISTWQAVRATRAERVALAAQLKESQSRIEADAARVQADTSRQNEVRLRRQAESTLNELELERAGELFAAADTSRALAYLADMLRRSPTNQVAAARALSALIHHHRAVFLTQPLEHQGEVVSAHFSADGQRVVTASLDKTARVWDADKGRPLSASLNHEGPVRSAQFSPDGQRVLTASDDETARIWVASTGKPLTGPLKHEHLVTGAQFSADGGAVVTVSADRTARVWNAETGQPRTGALKHEGRVDFAEFSRDGLWVVTASHDETARVWNAKTGQPLTEPLRHHGQVVSASFSPDSRRVVTASYDKSARIWDTRTGEPMTGPLLHEEGVVSAQFSPDGNRVVTASWDKSARIWDVRTGQPLTQRLQHQDEVVSAQFSPDGRRVVTASWDKSARVWDVATGQPMTEALSHRDRVLYAEFSPEGQRVVTASADRTARVWEVPLAFLPVPEWVPRLMEAVATKRFNEQGVFEPVSTQEIAALKQELAASSASNDWIRCARWLFADPSARTISPFSSITLGDYVEHLMEGATQDRPQEAISRMKEAERLAPKNGLVLASLVRAALSANQTPERDLMADWYSRRAIKLSPDQPETWRARGEFFNETGRLSEALGVVETGLAVHPQNPELWYDHGRMLAKTNRTGEAYGSFTKAIDFAQANRTGPSPALTAFYLSRSYLLSRQGRFADAAADFRRIRDIPPRDPNASAGLIDLSLYYNVSLVGGNWHVGQPLGSSDWASGNDLSEVPRGLHKLAGVEFDIRGAVQVGGPTRTGEVHPAKIAGIVVGLSCRRLHFLHSAIYAGGGGTIGKYVVHYQNGQSAEIPLIDGRDLSDWLIRPTEKQLQVAWTGSEPYFGGSHHLCLCKTTWENAFPDLPVSTIDFEASGKGGFPFLVAVTVE